MVNSKLNSLDVQHTVRSAYQPPASSTFLSEQISHQHSSLRTNQHQPSATSQPNRLVYTLVWIISGSDPNYANMEKKVLDIHADVDNPIPIVYGYELGYGVSDIRRIWIIR
jgi:hypothetical protein